MSAAIEAQLVFGFSALLAVGSVVLLFVPLLRHVRLFSASRAGFAAVILSLLGLSAAAVFVVVFAISDPAYIVPIAAVTVALRLASPSLLYLRIRDRFEAARRWSHIRIVIGASYLIPAAILAYGLFRILAGQEPPGFALLSEQLVMALGASAFIVRAALRLRPRDSMELWPVWFAATLFAVAFVLVAPYAFPVFATLYVLSGMAGWITGTVVVRFVD